MTSGDGNKLDLYMHKQFTKDELSSMRIFYNFLNLLLFSFKMKQKNIVANF